MLVHDLQTFLSKFTEGSKKGSNGNALSHAKLYVEKDGYLEEIKRMEIQEELISLFKLFDSLKFGLLSGLIQVNDAKKQMQFFKCWQFVGCGTHCQNFAICFRKI